VITLFNPKNGVSGLITCCKFLENFTRNRQPHARFDTKVVWTWSTRWNWWLHCRQTTDKHARNLRSLWTHWVTRILIALRNVPQLSFVAELYYDFLIL